MVKLHHESEEQVANQATNLVQSVPKLQLVVLFLDYDQQTVQGHLVNCKSVIIQRWVNKGVSS